MKAWVLLVWLLFTDRKTRRIVWVLFRDRIRGALWLQVLAGAVNLCVASYWISRLFFGWIGW